MSSAPVPPSSASSQNTSDTSTPKQKPILAALSVITLLIAIAIAGFWGYTGSTSATDDANLFGLRRFFGAGGRAASASRGFAASTSTTTSGRVLDQVKKLGEGVEDRVAMARTPVYFLSHGGVGFLSSPFSCFCMIWGGLGC